IAALLHDNDEVSAIDIRVAASYVDAIAAGSEGLRDGARRVATATESGSVELVFRPPRGNREAKERWWRHNLPIIRTLRRSETARHLDKLDVIRQSERRFPEVVDYLSQEIATFQDVDLMPNSRHTDPDAARAAIIDAYNQVRREI